MKYYISLLLALLLLTGCGQTKLAYSIPATAPELVGTALPLQESEQVPDRAETVERKIVKQGNIRFATADVDETKALITQTVRELNGYISDDNVDAYADQLQHRLIIRVPADKFDVLLQTISESVSKFDSRKIEALDVTEEYIDLAARIKTKKELQSRYTELLKQASKVEEILLIEKEIGSLQTEIESVEGRMRYLNDRIALSTLTVAYYQKIKGIESRIRFFSELTDGIQNGWEGFLWFIVGLSHLWVFILFCITIFLLRLWRKKTKNSA